jgi:hypothetical protein
LGNSAAALGLLLILTASLASIRLTDFPGWWALLPTVGTALIIVVGPRAWVCRAFLSHRWLVSLGLISYPLYLWHWPLLAFTRIMQPNPPIQLRGAVILLSVALAILTYRFLEKPIRAARRQPSRRVAGILLGGMLASFCVGAAIQSGAFPERLSTLRDVITAKDDWAYPGGEQVYVPGRQQNMILFFGDSYIEQYFPRIRFLSDAHPEHRAVLFRTREGCAPIPRITRLVDPRCSVFADEGFKVAAAPNVGTIVIGASWLGFVRRGDYYRTGDREKTILGLEAADAEWIYEPLIEEIRQLISAGKDVYIVLNPPGGARAAPDSGISRLAKAQQPPPRAISLAEHLERTGAINARIRSIAERGGARVLDPADWMCTASGCPVTDAAGVPIYKDTTHLRASFVRQHVHAFDELVLAR